MLQELKSNHTMFLNTIFDKNFNLELVFAYIIWSFLYLYLHICTENISVNMLYYTVVISVSMLDHSVVISVSMLDCSFVISVSMLDCSFVISVSMLYYSIVIPVSMLD